MGRHWWGVCQLQGAVAAAIDLAEGRASTVKWRQNYDRELQLIAKSFCSGLGTFELATLQGNSHLRRITAQAGL